MAMVCRMSEEDAVIAYIACRSAWSEHTGQHAEAVEAPPLADVHNLRCEELLARMLDWEVLTLVVIGSGRASAGHKMRALAWSIMLQSSWEGTATLLSGAHFITDFGT